MTPKPNITRYLDLVRELGEETEKIQEFLKPYILDLYDFLAEQVSEEGDDPNGKFLKVSAERLGIPFPHHLMYIFDYPPSSFTFQGYLSSQDGEFFLTENVRALEGMGYLPVPAAFIDDSEKWKQETLAAAGL